MIQHVCVCVYFTHVSLCVVIGVVVVVVVVVEVLAHCKMLPSTCPILVMLYYS